jgi:hypothetical protein
MNTDYRIKTDTLDHPKILKLERICGEHGVLCLIRLWGFVARYHPKGCMNEMTGEDIEIAARWHGTPGQLFQNLEQLKLIDKTEAGYEIHDWKEHNAFCYHAPERCETARKNIEQRWNKRLYTSGNTDGNTPLPTPTPIPSPTPKPKPNPKPKKEKDPLVFEFVKFWFAGNDKVNLSDQYDALMELHEKHHFTLIDLTIVLTWLKQGQDQDAFFWRGNVMSFSPLLKSKDGVKCDKYLKLQAAYLRHDYDSQFVYRPIFDRENEQFLEASQNAS